MDIQEAIKWYQTKLAINNRFSLHGNQDEAAKLALSALQEQAEREKGCEYCCGEIEVDTPFCPYCGKRLK